MRNVEDAVTAPAIAADNVRAQTARPITLREQPGGTRRNPDGDLGRCRSRSIQIVVALEHSPRRYLVPSREHSHGIA